MNTKKQNIELAEQYLKANKIDLGSAMANDTAVDIFLAGIESVEKTYSHTLDEFKDAYIKLFKFHCEEYIKLINSK